MYGGICWYCHWGWAAPVAKIYAEALARLDEDDSPLEYGPGHVVWGDENFDMAECCLEEFEAWVAAYNREDDGMGNRLTPEDLAVVRWSLEALAALPVSVRCPEPEDYDGEHPESFPPPGGVTMVKARV